MHCELAKELQRVYREAESELRQAELRARARERNFLSHLLSCKTCKANTDEESIKSRLAEIKDPLTEVLEGSKQ